MLKPQDSNLLLQAVREIAARCPRLTATCYWAGTSSIAIEELRHRQSCDIDFHTCRALADIRPVLAELEQVFGDKIEVVDPPDEFGSGCRAVLQLALGQPINLEILSNYEDVPSADLIPAKSVPGIRRVSLERYLADKVQCLAERHEARDLVDIQAVLEHHPELVSKAKQFIRQQDAIWLAERLMSWSDEALRADLLIYPDVDANTAMTGRDTLFTWLKELSCEENI